MAFSHCERLRVLISKLSLLSKLSERGDSIGQIFSGLPQESLKLVRECRYLEEKLSCQGCTDALLSSQSSRREMKREILQTDWDVCITEANNHSSTTIAARIATNVSWLKLWDMALDHGPHGTVCLQALYRELTRPQFQKGICHLCGTVFNSPLFSLTHTSLQPGEVNLLFHLLT